MRESSIFARKSFTKLSKAFPLFEMEWSFFAHSSLSFFICSFSAFNFSTSASFNSSASSSDRQGPHPCLPATFSWHHTPASVCSSQIPPGCTATQSRKPSTKNIRVEKSISFGTSIFLLPSGEIQVIRQNYFLLPSGEIQVIRHNYFSTRAEK